MRTSLAVLSLIATVLLGCRAAPETQSPPDIVLVIVDTLRADRLGAYGSERGLTPRIDELAVESIVFERSLSSSTWTLPSTATLLTGLLPEQHGLRSIRDRLPEGVVTVAERLQAAGYRTAAFTDGGFVGSEWGFGQGFDEYSATPGPAWGPKDVKIVVDGALGWLERVGEEPFFLMVHTYETHQPYLDAEGFAADLLTPECWERFPDGARMKPQEPWPVEDRDCVAALYDGGVRRADHYLGGLFDALRARPRWERTAVVLTSDHGEELAEHGDWEHGLGKVFDENVAVPLLLKLPGAARTGRSAAPVTGIDVAPTLLDLAGVTPASDLTGTSLVHRANAPQGRAILVHGLNSFPDRPAERLRLDIGPKTIIADVVAEVVDVFDRERDPEMREPSPFDPSGKAEQRLMAIVAWSGRGDWVVRLPEGVEGVSLPASAGLRITGSWQGPAWSGADRPGRAWRVDPNGAPVFVALRGVLVEGRPLELLVENGAGVRTRLTLDTSTFTAGWHPLLDPLPAPLELIAGPRRHRVVAEELSAEERRELEALGYL